MSRTVHVGQLVGQPAREGNCETSRKSVFRRNYESRGGARGTRVGTHVKPLDSFVSASTSCLQLSQKGSAALLGMVATPAMVTASRAQSARESEASFLPFGKRNRRDSRASFAARLGPPQNPQPAHVLTRPPKKRRIKGVRKLRGASHHPPGTSSRTIFTSPGRDERANHRHRRRPRGAVRRAHRAGARRARAAPGQVPLPGRQLHQGHQRH